MQDFTYNLFITENFQSKEFIKSRKIKFYTEKEFLNIDFYLKAKRSMYPIPPRLFF